MNKYINHHNPQYSPHSSSLQRNDLSLFIVSLSLKNTFTTYQVFLKAVRTLGRADETVCIEVKLYVLFHDKGSQTVTIRSIV